MSQLYLTLPSNSSNDIYPNNTSASYTVRLHREILLESGEWEVGLAEIHFPYNKQLPQTLHICTNIIEHQLVGTGLQPLLRIIGLKGRKEGEIISKVYERPHYKPASGGVLRAVDIKICKDMKSVNVTGGPVTAVLHLRRVKEPYFHI